jgi:putative FmdB family regulatory protein
MAIYVYHCRECDTEFTEQMPMSEFVSEYDCPECGAPAPNRIQVTNWKRSPGWFARLQGSTIRPGYAAGWT